MSLTSISLENHEPHGERMGPNEGKQGHTFISVVVCTYNRSTCLASCLQSLAEQSADKESFEVLVVDNNSSDNTRQVAVGYVNKYSYFRMLFEPCQGLSHARNRGWMEAHGQYVAYIDDDAIAYPDWISSIVNFIGRHPDSGIFGGPYDVFYQLPKPDWFPPEYGSLQLGEQERPIKLGSEWISGSNMVIRKVLFYQHGGFDARLGMTGGNAAYGEEVKLFISMHDKGIQIFYVPSIRVKHLVAGYKMSLNWLLLSGYSVGRRYELTFNVNRSLLSHIVSLINELGVAICHMLRPVSIPFKRRLYYSLYRLYYEAGAVVEHVSAYSCVKKP
jgi:glycosyltransferase involved in cell wall biosynthesis